MQNLFCVYKILNLLQFSENLFAKIGPKIVPSDIQFCIEILSN